MAQHAHDPKLPHDAFTADLERDSKDRPSSSMEGLVREDAALPEGEPVEEEYIADPEAHRQHSRKGQSESPREVTFNQPEHKRHDKHTPPTRRD